MEEFVRCEIVSVRSVGGVNGLLKVYARCESSRLAGSWYDVFLVVKNGELVRASCSCPGWAFTRVCKHIKTVEVMLRVREGGGL